jgi:Ca-activated chloride channel family protein
MRAQVHLSTRFLTTQNAHQVGILTTLSGETPPSRAPINVVLVLDRSGSMSGVPLAAAREAARRFAGFLGANDRLSVVAFDDEVTVVSAPAPAGNPAVLDAISRIQVGGSTNLSGGWLKAFELARQGLVDGVNRIVLLTDGQANCGITDLQALTAMVRSGADSRVSTTCIGFGAGFNEDLLQALGREGRANYWYVERDDQMAGVFEGEIEGLVALGAQNVAVEVRLLHPKASGVTFLQRYPVTRTGDGGWSASLGDLYATSPLALGLVVHVEEVETLGVVPVAEVRCMADVIMPNGIEHRVITQVLQANLDGADHPEPLVEKTFLRFAAATSRDEAIKLADEGDGEGAARVLREVADKLVPYADDAEFAQERADLVREADDLRDRAYSPSDRKYMQAMSMTVREGKKGYRDKLRRPRRKE